MKAVLQRVHNANVTIEGQAMSKINKGLVVLLGVAKHDTPRDVALIVEKIKHLRIFDDENGKMNRSIQDIDGELLVVSQFTLLADLKSGRRPSLSGAAPPTIAQELYRQVIDLFKTAHMKVREGRFGAHMNVSLVNDGPVTFVIDTKDT